MKNQTNQTWLWQGLVATALLMTLGMDNAFADASDCVNPSELTLDGQVTMKFCDIPAAQGVLIGSENGRSDEKPVKARNFEKFQIAQFEVTQLQYKTIIGAEPWKENGKLKSYVQEGDNNPAVYVSYNEAQQFVRVLNWIDKTATYRLPTEAEFEYAARAETNRTDVDERESLYYWGDEMDSSFAYFRGNTETTGQYARKVDSCPSHILDKKLPGYCANGFGLYHMLGNVWEWTADAYVNSYANAPTDGNEAVQADGNEEAVRGGRLWNLRSARRGEVGSDRVMRGGRWNGSARNLRSARRGSGAPDYRYFNVGFRLVRTAK